MVWCCDAKTDGWNFSARQCENVSLHKNIFNTDFCRMKNVLILDIETAPLPEWRITFPEFKAPANFKDPAKIAEAIAEKRAEFLERAALNATTGFVCAIGTMEQNDEGDWDFSSIEHPRSEAEIIQNFWDKIPSPRTVVTFYGKSFDFPFLVRRSWILGLRIPSWIRDGRYWSRDIIDLFEDWQLGNRETSGSLDLVSKTVLGRGKTGDGADFWKQLQTEPLAALEYLAEDCALTKDLFLRFYPGLQWLQ